MRIQWLNAGAVAACVIAGALIAAKNIRGRVAHQLLNVSYDPTRELYQHLNPVFAARYEQETGESVGVRQSHGGSAHQAKLVATEEQAANVVTLGLPSDIESIEKHGLIDKDWRTRLPDNSEPYHSTIVFVVRKGNPLHILDWPEPRPAERRGHRARPEDLRKRPTRRARRVGVCRDARRRRE